MKVRKIDRGEVEPDICRLGRIRRRRGFPRLDDIRRGILERQVTEVKQSLREIEPVEQNVQGAQMHKRMQAAGLVIVG